MHTAIVIGVFVLLSTFACVMSFSNSDNPFEEALDTTTEDQIEITLDLPPDIFNGKIDFIPGSPENE